MRYWKTYIPIYNGVRNKPTRYFPLLIAAIVGLFMLAYMHNYNIVYLMMFFTFALAGASSMLGQLNLAELQLRFYHNDRMFANTRCRYLLKLRNPNPTRHSFAIELTTPHDRTTLDELPPNEEVNITLEITPEKRGELVLPDVRITTLFPLPHEILYKDFLIDQRVTVYPEPKGTPLSAFIAKKQAYTGEQDDFDGLRSYQEGDTLSLIHWPSVAKGAETMSKAFIYNDTQQEYLFDFLSAGDDDETRLSQLTLWVLECERRGHPCRVTLPGRSMDSEKEGYDAILDQLAHY
jgi:uncharacterized protein (DUF58 family)